MIKTTYQTPELRNSNNEVVQEGAFGKNTALSNSTNDGWIDYVMNDLEALHDTIGDSAPTLDGNGHVVEPANLAIGDEDGVRLKTGYVKTTGGTIHGTLNVSRVLQMYDNQDNILGGILASPTTTTDRFMVLFGGDGYNNAVNRLYFYNTDGNPRFALQTGDGTTNYSLIGYSDGRLTWRGNPVATLNAPAFTGNPTAPTQAVNNNSTRLATTEYVVKDLKADTPLLTDVFADTIPTNADLDDYTTSGTYRCNGSSVAATLANCPISTSGFKLVVMSVGYGSSTYCMQLLFGTTAQVWIRSRIATTSWNDWYRVAYTQNVLPLTGGTMTGDLKINKYTPAIKEKSSYTRGESLSSERSVANLQFIDNDENQLGGVYFIVNTDNSTLILLRANNINGTLHQVCLQVPTSGNPYFRGRTDNDYNLGIASYRWKQLFAGTTTISTSDERLKDNIVAIPEEVLDAWGEVGWYQYQFKDSIAEKGETKARLHTGAIAQRIESIFASHGLDANKYGLLCYDEWKAEPAERDEEGNIIQEARPAGNRYSLRYEEALCMEAAYQRRRADRLESRIEALERAINNAL